MNSQKRSIKFKSKYPSQGLPTKTDILHQAFEQIKSNQGFNQFDSGNDKNTLNVLIAVYNAGLKRGKKSKNQHEKTKRKTNTNL